MATLRQLEIFLAVAEYKKMNEAAKKLYISQPTVSQSIADLESEYHVTLFDRQPRGLQITPAGRLLLGGAQKILAINEELENAMHNKNAIRRPRIGATLTIGNTLMGSVIDRLRELHSDIEVTGIVDNTQNIENRLIHHKLDIALVEGTIIQEDILTEPVIEDHLMIICGRKHPFFGRTSIRIEELQNQDFIMREEGSGTRSLFENIMLTHHVPIHTIWECCSGTAIIDAVRHNLGLGALSQRCIQEYVDAGEIGALSIEGVSMKRSFHICYNQRYPLNSQMHDFVSIIREF